MNDFNRFIAANEVSQDVAVAGPTEDESEVTENDFEADVSDDEDDAEDDSEHKDDEAEDGGDVDEQEDEDTEGMFSRPKLRMTQLNF